jgi:hypothetical protein
MMGHIRLGTLPRTKKWDQVVHLISGRANVEHIAAASAEAAERGLERASNDEGLAQAVWLLTQLPQAARHGDFSKRLWKLGLRVSSRPTLVEIVASLTQAIDAHLQETGKRSDFGELALHAASQTIASLAGQELHARRPGYASTRRRRRYPAAASLGDLELGAAKFAGMPVGGSDLVLKTAMQSKQSGGWPLRLVFSDLCESTSFRAAPAISPLAWISTEGNPTNGGR